MNVPKADKLLAVIDEQPYPLLFVTVSGAHLYGFASEDSDYDLRGTHVLPVRDVVSLNEPKETIENSEIRDGLELDLVTHDIKKFFMLMLKRNGYVLEQLYSPLVLQTTPEHEELKRIANSCITRIITSGSRKISGHCLRTGSPNESNPYSIRIESY